LTARALEQAGICTVIIGSALDIVSHCGVPRYLHNNLPLGNPMGKPFDTKMQATTLRLALDLVISATAPVIQHTPFRWSESEAWRENYMRCAWRASRTAKSVWRIRRKACSVTDRKA
jgi:D-proline reductase (dithiol) PrdB